MRSHDPRKFLRGSLFSAAIACLYLPASAQIAFEDTSVRAGVSGNATESFGAAWGDMNSDGYPDLFIDNHRDAGRLWINNGNGTFTDITTVADSSDAFGPDSLTDKDTHGSSWVDFNNDGNQDLSTTWSVLDGHYMLSDGNRVLVDEGPTRGIDLEHDNGSRQPIWVDVDNDGLLDLKVLGLRESSSNVFMQSADGNFTLTSDLANIRCPKAQWGQLIDVNASGTLELMCGTSADFPIATIDFSSGVGVELGVEPVHRSRDGVVGDFNNDGRQDIIHIVGAFRPTQALLVPPSTIEWHNALTTYTRERTLTVRTAGRLRVELDDENWGFITNAFGSESDVYIGSDGHNPSGLSLDLSPTGNNRGVQQPNGRDGAFIGYVNGEWSITFSSVEGTFNNGYFVISSDQPIDSIDLDPTIGTDRPIVPELLLNTASGFVSATDGSGLDAVQCVSGVAADFDNDMDQDVYMACRDGAENLANTVFENLGDGTFRRVSSHGGEGATGAALSSGAGISDSVVAADYDRDGFIDLFVANGLNLFPLRAGGESQLFRNVGNNNNWIEIQLVGVQSNRDAIGAKVRVTAGGVEQYREQNGGYHRWSQNSQTIHFGLAGNDSARVEITWPSGRVDVYNAVDANEFYKATEAQGIEPFSTSPPPPPPTPTPPPGNGGGSSGGGGSLGIPLMLLVLPMAFRRMRRRPS